jgi:transposase InsO family protein
MDVYSRRIIGYSLADNMRSENNLAALKMALQMRGQTHYHNQLIHHSDKGSQYISDIYTQTLDEYGILISLCNEVYENTHIERVNDTIKNQYIYRWQIKSERELKRKVDQTIVTYNTKRPHHSLGKLTPVEYELKLKDIPHEKRKIMEIYTINNSDPHDPDQLCILFN